MLLVCKKIKKIVFFIENKVLIYDWSAMDLIHINLPEESQKTGLREFIVNVVKVRHCLKKIVFKYKIFIIIKKCILKKCNSLLYDTIGRTI